MSTVGFVADRTPSPNFRGDEASECLGVREPRRPNRSSACQLRNRPTPPGFDLAQALEMKVRGFVSIAGSLDDAGAPRRISDSHDIDQNAVAAAEYDHAMWQRISTAPFDRDLQLGVIEGEDVHALVFPCRRVADGWVSATTGQRVAVSPTHWRNWDESLSHSSPDHQVSGSPRPA